MRNRSCYLDIWCGTNARTKGREPFSWETALVIELDELGMASGQGKYKLG